MSETAPNWNKKVLTAQEAAQYIGISLGTLRNLTSSNKIPHYKPRAKMLYFKLEEIEDWLLKGRVKTTEEVEREALNYVANKSLKLSRKT